MSELIWATICPGLAIVCLVISVLQFKEKGFLFNNAYIWAAKQERETMNGKMARHHQKLGCSPDIRFILDYG